MWWASIITPLWILCGSIAMYIVEAAYRRRYPELWTTSEKRRWWIKSVILGPIGLAAAWSVYGKHGDY